MARTFLNAALFAGFAFVLWGIISDLSGIRVSQATDEGTYEDAYYVVAHVHLIMGILTALALPGLSHLFVLRKAARVWMLYASYACLFLSLAGMLLWAHPEWILGDPGPWRYTDYSNLANRFAAVTFTGVAMVLTASVTSLTLAILELIHRRKST
ncbi:hypothetical protein [Gymnodinialimonas hymeniacidonis]|uniref:hypothetical protein n=1 Tax=Gymnodinialimonas hymeniacidonis TaxID=3126508 RepID=UPI0034C5E52C